MEMGCVGGVKSLGGEGEGVGVLLGGAGGRGLVVRSFPPVVPVQLKTGVLSGSSASFAYCNYSLHILGSVVCLCFCFS